MPERFALDCVAHHKAFRRRSIKFGVRGFSSEDLKFMPGRGSESFASGRDRREYFKVCGADALA